MTSFSQSQIFLKLFFQTAAILRQLGIKTGNQGHIKLRIPIFNYMKEDHWHLKPLVRYSNLKIGPLLWENQDEFPHQSRLPWFFKLDLFDAADQRVNKSFVFSHFKLCWTCLRSRGNRCLRLQSCFDSSSNSWAFLLSPDPSPGAHKNRSLSSTCCHGDKCLSKSLYFYMIAPSKHTWRGLINLIHRHMSTFHTPFVTKLAITQSSTTQYHIKNKIEIFWINPHPTWPMDIVHLG